MSLFFNALSRLVITFLPKSKRLLISWMKYMDEITICNDFGAQENKVSVSIVSLSICHEVMEPEVVILVF